MIFNYALLSWHKAATTLQRVKVIMFDVFVGDIPWYGKVKNWICGIEEIIYIAPNIHKFMLI